MDDSIVSTARIVQEPCLLASIDGPTITQIAEEAKLIIGLVSWARWGEEDRRSMVKGAAFKILALCEGQTTFLPQKSEPELSVSDQKRLRDEKDVQEKPSILEQREKAGEFVIPFGKHKDKKMKQVPLDYIRWILGFKQEGKRFNPLETASSYIKNSQPETLANAHKYMLWRCWACGVEDTRFKNAKLCTSCWHE